MTGDPLYRPLGMEPRPARGPLARRVVRIGTAVVLVAGLGAVAAIAVRHRMADDPRVAVARIDLAPSAPAASEPAEPPATAAVRPTPAPEATSAGTSVEMQNGVKIIRFNGGSSAASVTLPVGRDDAVALTPAPDPRVSEKTADGTLPRIGPLGARASAVYARHDPAAKGPRIAVVLLGLGGDQPATADAARRLPAAIGFGFTAEASDGAVQVADARRLGHEAFLDLRESAAPTAAAAGPDPARALRRRLGRWPGYVGVVLDPGAMSAAAEEASRRGVLSIAATPSPALAVTRSIDAVADAAQGQQAVAAGLGRLVEIAKSKGSALGVIDHAAGAGAGVAAALEALAAQPVALVPASAILSDRAGAVDASR